MRETIEYDNGTYTGEIIKGERHGYGKYVWTVDKWKGDVYEGEWKHGKRTGVGVYSRHDGVTYCGTFVDGAWQGRGMATYSDGDSYDGKWTQGRETGGWCVLTDGTERWGFRDETTLAWVLGDAPDEAVIGRSRDSADGEPSIVQEQPGSGMSDGTPTSTSPLPRAPARNVAWFTRLLRGNEEKAWGKADRRNTPKGYRKFLSSFPESGHASTASEKLNELEWSLACQTDTLEAYLLFLSQTGEGLERRQERNARSRINEIWAERKKIEAAVHGILPKDVEGQMEFTDGKTGCVLRISAHLLKAYSPKSTDPQVHGDYGSHSRLEDYVKRRSADIYVAVFSCLRTITLATVVVECRHGVRYVVVGGPGSGDHATTLYCTQLFGETAKHLDWSQPKYGDIWSAWQVVSNLIPEVQFHYGW